MQQVGGNSYMATLQDIQKQLSEFCGLLKLSTKPNLEVDPETLLKCLLSGSFRNTALLQPDGSYKTIVSHQVIGVSKSAVGNTHIGMGILGCPHSSVIVSLWQAHPGHCLFGTSVNHSEICAQCLSPSSLASPERPVLFQRDKRDFKRRMRDLEMNDIRRCI